jgi:hypothetical protein
MNKDLDSLLDNEREWRRYLMTQMSQIQEEFQHTAKEISAIKVWNLVFRLVGGAIFAILLVWVESKLGHGG